MIICSVQYGRVTVYARVRIIIIFMYSIYMFIVCKLYAVYRMSTDLPYGIKIYIIYYLYAFQSPTHDEIYVENYVKERQTYTVRMWEVL